jgi:3D (Asp-Asp-Asp) domain-containing protein
MTLPTLLMLVFFGSQHTYVAPEPEPPPIMAVVTAYTSSVDETDSTPDITASGSKTREGIAACPRKYPFGTKVVIDDRIYVCEDRMHIRFNDRFDIWMPTKKEAFEWGRQTLPITVYENELTKN